MTYVTNGATLSPCGTYRYRLWREWRGTPNARWRMWTNEDGSPALDGAGHQLGEPEICVFIMLNPSTADAEVDDPTIRRCVGFARSWGYEHLEVANLFAYRTPSPKALMGLTYDDDPVGPLNSIIVRDLISDPLVTRIICAWGAHGDHLLQHDTVLGWIEQWAMVLPECLGFTKLGYPRHPLYVPSDQQPERLW